MIKASENNDYCLLDSPTAMPKAAGFLWNEKMMIHMNCRGYAVAQFMQPEPGKYSHAPNLEAKTFMQPEQPYYAHHPGRFVYVKDEETGSVFSAPYEPVRVLPEVYTFAAGKHDIRWKVLQDGIEAEMTLSLPVDEPLELWTVKVVNRSGRPRKLSVYPYFSIGYMSWMNQSAEYRQELQAIVGTSISPYQKYQDYAKIKGLKDKTFLLASDAPDAFETNRERFEGEGGLHRPSALDETLLSCGDARYETPDAVMQYRTGLEDGGESEWRFVFGPARTEEEIADIRERYFLKRNADGKDGFEAALDGYAAYVAEGRGCLEMETPDPELDRFVNHWLPRQMYYHGQTNRLTTDPQTRNYLQDNMGMSYIKPETARAAFLTALSQQHVSGEMPDGILLHPDAELKYINQVPHTDHCIWLPVCLITYLDETGDRSILDEMVPFAAGAGEATVYAHIDLAMKWLIRARDERGLNYINQGDWCDPMNMVGYKGIGVSAWLTIASAYAFKEWAGICEMIGRVGDAAFYREEAGRTNEASNRYFWDGEWYARGITDDNVTFGVKEDQEGRIFINPQTWALLSGAADSVKQEKLIRSVEEQLESPYGVEKLAPSFTAMREDVGRVTQKHPGSAENGAVYNHAAAFYIYALYEAGRPDDAFRLLRKMIPAQNKEDMLRRGQMPIFIPNYYRGAYRQFPEVAGRSSHLFNTGTTAWVYRCLIDGLFGLRGTAEGLRIEPQLPSDWNEASVSRTFRGAAFTVKLKRDPEAAKPEVYADGVLVADGVIREIDAGASYRVEVKLPMA